MWKGIGEALFATALYFLKPQIITLTSAKGSLLPSSAAFKQNCRKCAMKINSMQCSCIRYFSIFCK